MLIRQRRWGLCTAAPGWDQLRIGVAGFIRALASALMKVSVSEKSVEQFHESDDVLLVLWIQLDQPT
jgi:hypothetical protein